MVELEYNGERYMVDGGKWYRRLKVGEVVNFVNQMRSSLDGKWLQCSALISGIVSSCEVNNYRVPCTDPRPPFVVGQRVKVARKDERWELWDESDAEFVGMCGSVVRVGGDGDFRIRFDSGFLHTFPPWCLDPVEPSPVDELTAQELGMYDDTHNPMVREPDSDPELDHILRKLDPHAHLAADVRRIKRECYQKLAALLPEEMR